MTWQQDEKEFDKKFGKKWQKTTPDGELWDEGYDLSAEAEEFKQWIKTKKRGWLAERDGEWEGKIKQFKKDMRNKWISEEASQYFVGGVITILAEVELLKPKQPKEEK